MNKKILCLVTARASYSRVRTVLISLQRRTGIDLTIALNASASDPLYGDLREVVENDGFTNVHSFETNLSQTSSTSSIKVVALSLLDIEAFMRFNKFDGVISIADRYETIATAICASYSNTKLFHIQGGEISGNIDDKVRNAISMMADYHFPSTAVSAENLERYGICVDNIFQYGCPSVDQFVSIPSGLSEYSFHELLSSHSVGHAVMDYGDYHVIMQHAETDKTKDNFDYTSMLIDLVKESKSDRFLWFWPNTDPGSNYISKALRIFRESESCDNVRFIKNLSPNQFIYILNGSLSLIGNSSVGVRETGILGVPVINIGDRQRNRESHCNVRSCEWNKNQLQNTFREIKVAKRVQPDFTYGEGSAGKLIAKKITEII
jgi:UDP-hydrolysing UDP-N-acetyl-D-glucosamine 2-epimerase